MTRRRKIFSTIAAVVVIAAFVVVPSLLERAYRVELREEERLQDAKVLLTNDPARAPIVFGVPVSRGWPKGSPDLKQPSLILRYNGGKLASEKREIDMTDVISEVNALLSEKKAVHLILVIGHGSKVPDVVPVVANLRESKVRLITVNFEF